MLTLRSTMASIQSVWSTLQIIFFFFFSAKYFYTAFISLKEITLFLVEALDFHLSLSALTSRVFSLDFYFSSIFPFFSQNITLILFCFCSLLKGYRFILTNISSGWDNKVEVSLQLLKVRLLVGSGA